MKVLRSIPELACFSEPLSLAVGVFDGLHLGHQAVLHSAQQEARSGDGRAVVVTFEPHPVRVLRPEKAPRLLASLPHKSILLDRFELDALLVVAFDQVFAQLSAEEFIGKIVEACRQLRSISVGSGWRFGAGRGGNLDSLTSLGKAHDFCVHPVEPITFEGQAISSTRIRAAISEGDLRAAQAMLGRDYTVLGTVVAGRQLGRSIGFPTANLRVLDEQLPPDGVYAVRALHAGAAYDGIANVGLRPTVVGDGLTRHFEVHVFDFDKQIYGEEVEVTFAGFLRAEEKFADIELLRKQITRDCENACKALSESPISEGSPLSDSSSARNRP